MLYDNYKSKILIIAKVWETIKRFRILILSCLLAVTATVTGLLIAKGAIYGDADCPTQFTYGDTLDYGAGAFMGEVTYEYCEVGTDKWSASPPSKPGEYKVRAVSKGAFGGKREGEEHVFTITARNVLVTVAEEEIVYGELPTVVSDAAETDTVSCAQFEYTGVGTDETEVAPIADSITIANANGEDVTACYSIDVEFTPVSFLKRSITVTAGSASRNYDGTPLTSDAFEITEGSVAENDEISVECNGMATNAGALVVNVPTVRFFNADGIEVTEYYDIATVNGTLLVGNRPVLITCASGERIYDGELFSIMEFDEDGAFAQLVEGHRIEVIKGTQITDVGSVQNKFETVEIYDESGNAVTSNYAISYAQTSRLTILPRPITVTSESGTHTYDGQPFRLSENTVSDDTPLAFGDQIYCNYSGQLTDVGTAENTFEVREIMNNGRNVTGNYDITLAFGTLEVAPRPVTITTETDAKEYDGEKFSATDATADDLVTGHALKMLNSTEITYVSENAPNNNIVEYEIVNGAGDIVTANYDPFYVYGTLTIKPRQIEITIVDKEKIYDGTPLTSAETSVTCVDGREWPAGHSLTVQTYGSQTNYGISENVFVRNSNGQIVMTVTRESLPSTTNLAENFEVVSTTDGRLTVNKRNVKLTSASADFVYADIAYSLEEIEVSDEEISEADRQLYPLVDGHTVETSGWGSITDAGLMYNDFSAEIFDGDGNNVSDNYLILRELGVINVHKRKVKIQVHSYTWIYDGTQHWDGDGTENVYGQSYEYTFDDCIEETVTNEIDSFHKPVEGHTLFMTSWSHYQNVTYKQLGNGTYDYEEIVGYQNVVGFSVKKNGVSQYNNYDISYIDGTVTILPRPLSLVSGSDNKIYDGTPLTVHNYAFGSEGLGLGLNHQIEASYTGEQTNAYMEGTSDEFGQSENTFSVIILDGDFNDVTVNYELDLEYGTLTVYPRPILVNRHDYSVMYDGEAHYDDLVYINEDLTIDGEYYPLADGHAFQYQSHSNTVTNVADSGRYNDVTLKVVEGSSLDMGAPDVTRNYTIEYQGGSLSITERPIKIITHTLDWTYDGRSHWDVETYTAQDLFVGEVDGNTYYTLVAGHSLSGAGARAYTNANATPQGEVYNTLKNEISFTVLGTENGVNDNYDITVEYGEFIIRQREISIIAKGAAKVYDATPLVVNVGDWEYEFNSPYELVDGHSLTVETSGAGRTDAGVTYNTMTVGSALILDDRNQDVTANYVITYNDSYIMVLSRPLYINTHSHEWVYDANAHYDECEYTNADLTEGVILEEISRQSYYLVDGHSLAVTAYTEITAADEVPNVLEFKVVDENGVDINAGNYEYHYNYGTLTVKQRPVNISTPSETWVYDGEEHWKTDGFTIEHGGEDRGLIGGHTYRFEAWTIVKDGGKTEDNHITVSIWNGDEEVTGNYRVIEENLGQLTVTRRPMYINIHSHEWIYDGFAHIDDCPYTSDDLTEGGINGVDYYKLVDGHSLQQVDYTTIINAGEVKNDLSFVVLDETGADVTANYSVERNDENAVLKILPRKIKIDVHDCVWQYDAQEHRDGDGKGLHYSANVYTEDEVIVEGEYLELPTGHRIKIASATTIKDVGTTENIVSLQILNANEEWIESNFIIEYTEGTLCVQQREITIVTGTDSKAYDGTPLTNPDVYVYEDWFENTSGLLSGHRLIAETNGSITEIGSIQNTLADGYAIVDAEGNVVTDNYNIAFQLGILQITRAPVIDIHPSYICVTYPSVQEASHDGTIDEFVLWGLLDVGYYYEVEMNPATQIGLGYKDVIISYFALYNANNDLVAEYRDGEWLTESENFELRISRGEVRVQAAFMLKVDEIEGEYPAVKSLTHNGTYEEGYNVAEMLAAGYTYSVEVEEKELNGIGKLFVDVTDFTLYKDEEAVVIYENGVWVLENPDYYIDLMSGHLFIYTDIFVQPISITENYPEVEVLTHTGELEQNDTLSLLVDNGYSYDYEVENAQQVGPGWVNVKLLWFKLYSPDGQLLVDYDAEEGLLEENECYRFYHGNGLLELIVQKFITIHLGEKTKVYDGAPLAYDETDEWWTVELNAELGKYEEVDLSATVWIEFNLSGIPSITNVGEGFDADAAKMCVTVYDAVTGENITSQYTVEFDEVTFGILPREIRLQTESASKKYDGTPLTNEVIYITFGAPHGGYTATAMFTGTQTEVGVSRNTIDEDSVKIFDSSGNLVAKENFAYTFTYGKLLVTSE